MKTLVAKRMKQLREERQMRQKTMSKILKIDQPTLSRYETGATEPPLEIIKKVSTFFNVSIDWLIGTMDTELEPIDYILAERVAIMSRRIQRNGIRDEFYKYILKQADLSADLFMSFEKSLKKKKTH